MLISLQGSILALERDRVKDETHAFIRSEPFKVNIRYSHSLTFDPLHIGHAQRKTADLPLIT